MKHHTKSKGDLAVVKTIADLISKGFLVFTPFSDHYPFDLIAYKDGICSRLQVKYRTNGKLDKATHWSDRNGVHRKLYSKDDFDYYALYIPDIDKVIYPSISFRGSIITTSLPNSASPFYWWEDFLDFTDIAAKKTYKDFGYKITLTKPRPPQSLIKPTKEVLSKLIWECPIVEVAKKFGVSDSAVHKWVKSYKLIKPPIGYWIASKRGPQIGK